MNFPTNPLSRKSSEPTRPWMPTAAVNDGLPELEAHARLIQINFATLSRFIEHAQHSFVELETKNKNLTLREQKITESESQTSQLEQNMLAYSENRNALDKDKQDFKEECRIYHSKRDEERILYLQQKILYALPRFLISEEARTTLARMQPHFENGAPGKQLQVFLSLAAVAEDSKDSSLYVKAITKLFPLLRELDDKTDPTARSFIDEFAELIGKGNEFGFQVKAPKKGEKVDESWMNSPINLRIINEVYFWAVINRDKAVVHKAEVK